MGEPLPPFGIRHLRNREPYSVLQITENEYRANIEHDPSAVLSYIDDDDGENVTVGSGLELKQRLDDPPPPNAPLAVCYNSAKNEFENRFIHLFDAQTTSSSRTIWRAQRRLYKKTRKQYEKSLKRKSEDDSISSIDLNAHHQDGDDENLVAEQGQEWPQTQPPSSAEKSVGIDFSDAVPDLVDNLAALLQTTSETLRKAAEKSRLSKTTPIEDVLSGVSNVVLEIGSFGLSLIDTLGERPENKTTTQTKPVNSKATSETASEASANLHSENSLPSLCLGITTNETSVVEDASTASFVSDGEHLTPQRSCSFCSVCRLKCRTSPESGVACHNCLTMGNPCSFTSTIEEVVPIPFDNNPELGLSNPNSPGHDSILDQDTEDADFSRRYPPLMSLRRANTIAGIHDHFVRPIEQNSNYQGLHRHSSWMRRYPHRPVPYVLDAETLRRRDFARHCYPAQHYTPGPGTKGEKPPPLLKGVSRALNPVDIAATQRDTAFHEPSFQSLSEAAPTDNHNVIVPDVVKLDSTTQATDRSTSSTLNDAQDTSADPNSKATSSAWPEPHDRQADTDGLSGESSGAFFHRMMRDNPSRRQHHASDTNERLTRHRSFSKPKSTNNPFSDLHRSHTISSSTANSASRLNRPFEPLYPVLTPVETRRSEEENITTPTAQDPVQHSTLETPPKSTERPSWTHRPFSPVWEENFNQNKIHGHKISKFDRNGESSSMYSPPPRHMRSVPNFATLASNTLSDNLITVTQTLPASNALRPTVHNRISPATLPKLGLDKVSLAKPIAPSVPYQVMFQREPTIIPSEKPSIAIAPPPNPVTAHTSGTLPKTPSRSMVKHATTDSESARNDKLMECLLALQGMGYGLGNDNLNSRLDIYVQAADGDVMEAVEMIEDDKKANSERS